MAITIMGNEPYEEWIKRGNAYIKSIAPSGLTATRNAW